MLIHCATLTEAKPLIEALDLKKVYQKPFALYRNDAHSLVVSGIGTIPAAAALGWALAADAQDVLNMGYAAGDSIGAIYNIDKVIDRCTNKVFRLKASEILPNATCETYPLPHSDPTPNLADMEASAVVTVTRRFGVECSIIKIVSDRFDPEGMKRNDTLIQNNISALLSLL